MSLQELGDFIKGVFQSLLALFIVYCIITGGR